MATTLRKYTSEEIVLGWFNEKRQLDLKVEDVEFTTPVRNEDSNPQYNSTVVIMPKLGTMYYGNYTHHYDRIHVSKFGAVIVDKGSALTLYELLPKINAVCNVEFTENDLIDYELDGDVIGNIVVDLQFKPESLLYYGGSIIYTPINPEPPPPDPENPDGPKWPEYGTKIGEYCQGPDLWGVYADGTGSYYRDLIESDVPSCGYTPGDTPVFTTVEGPNWDDVRDVNIAHPGQYVQLDFTLDKVATRALYFDIFFVWGTATTSDIAEIEYTYPGSVWRPVTGLVVMLPRNYSSFSIRMNINPDTVLLPEKEFGVDLRVNALSTGHVNPGVQTTNDIVITRARYESLLSLSNTQTTINEGTNAQLVYTMDQPIADATDLEIWFDYGVNLTKHFSSFQYSCYVAGSGSNVLNQTFVLDPITNKFTIPLPLGTYRLIVGFFISYDVNNSLPKLCDIKTQEMTITPKLVMVDNGSGGNIPGWTKYSIQVVTPSSIPNNTLLYKYCVDTDMWTSWWRNNHAVEELFASNSVECGYVEPPGMVLKPTKFVSNMTGTNDWRGVISPESTQGQVVAISSGRTSKMKTEVLSKDRMYFEFFTPRIQSTHNTYAFAITSVSDNEQDFIGVNATSYGFGYNRLTQVFGKYKNNVIEPLINVPEWPFVIGVYYDGIDGTVSIEHAGVFYENVYTGLTGDHYVAAGSTNAGTGAMVQSFFNFGQDPFVYPVRLGYKNGAGQMVPEDQYVPEVAPAEGILTPAKFVETYTPTNNDIVFMAGGRTLNQREFRFTLTDFAPTTGKYYFEVWSLDYIDVGLISTTEPIYPDPPPDDDGVNYPQGWGIGRIPNSVGYHLTVYDGIFRYKNGNYLSGISWPNQGEEQQWLGIAINFDTKTMYVRRDNTDLSGDLSFSDIAQSLRLSFTVVGDTAQIDKGSLLMFNFGQKPFKFAVPNGYNPGFGPQTGGG